MASVIQSYLQGGSMSNRADTLARAEQDRARSATLLRIGVVCFVLVCLVAMAVSQASFSRLMNLGIIIGAIGISIGVILAYAVKSSMPAGQRTNIRLVVIMCVTVSIAVVMYFAFIAWPT